MYGDEEGEDDYDDEQHKNGKSDHHNDVEESATKRQRL